jgi:hypothetical protein
MPGKSIRRPSPALVISVVALFCSLGGVGYAAATIGSAQIKNNSVKTADIKNNDVRGKDVRKNTLTGADILESKLGKVPSAGTADSAKITQVKTSTATGTAPASGAAGSATATCAAGLSVVGGGVQVADPNIAFIVDGFPSSSTAYTGRVSVGSAGTDQGFTVYAICATAAAAG